MYSYHPQEKELEQPKPENPSDYLASKVKPHEIISRKQGFKWGFWLKLQSGYV